MFSRATTLPVLVSLLALSACAGIEPSETPDESLERAEPVLTQPLEPLTAPEVLEYCPDEEAVHFDRDADSVEEIYRCTSEAGVERVERLVDRREQLLANYSEPNEFATAEACIELAPDPLILWLHMGEEITPVYAPVDECGFPNEVATNALELAEFETVLEVEVGETGGGEG